MFHHMESLLSSPHEESFLVILLEGPLSDTSYKALKKDVSLLDAVCPRLGTALHVAVMCGALRAVEALLDLGADRNVQDHEGRTPLDCLDDFYRRTREDYVMVSQDVHTYIQEMTSLLWEGN